MLTIHHLQYSQSERIIWLCEELGIPYTLKTYQRSPLLAPPELKALHPMGAAPVIVDDEPSWGEKGGNEENRVVLAESCACLDYIVAVYGNNRLTIPPTHKSYPHYLYWYHFANSTLQPTISALMMLRLASATLPNSNQRLTKVLTHLNDRLSEPNTPWLAGTELTAADILTVTSLTTIRVFHPFSLAPYPAILSYLQRVGARPAYQAAVRKGEEEGFVPVLGAEAPPVFRGFKEAGL